MSEYYEIKDLRHEKDGFEIRTMAKRIDAGYDAWFGFWAKAYFNGHEMGHANLGGLYYKDDHAEGVIEKKREYWYDDVIWEAVEEAKKQTGDLYKQLKLNFSFEYAFPKERGTS